MNQIYYWDSILIRNQLESAGTKYPDQVILKMFNMYKMKFCKILLPILFVGASLFAQNSDSLVIRRIYDQALADGHAYTNLAYLCKKIGPRLSGSLNAQKSVDWTKKLMDREFKAHKK